jgi:hypothetical protein
MHLRETPLVSPHLFAGLGTIVSLRWLTALSIPALYCASTRSIFCFASATACSFRGAKVRSVDREMSGKSARVG